MVGIDEHTKRRLRRGLRRRRKDAASLSQQADEQIEKLLIRRFDRLMNVRRFVLLWTSLLLLLIFSGVYQARSLSSYYQSLRPVPGGLFTEGVLDSFTNANPLYATGAADTAVSRLVFSGLFKYDKQNHLVGDLARRYEISPSQTRYTVFLKPGLRWQDGYPISASDVVFTYKTIQDISAQSPLYSSWQGIKVSRLDDLTVNFDLPNALSDFPYSLTNGIIPEHLLRGVPPEQLRSAPFNNQPVGSGPFEWKFVEVTGNTPQDREQRISVAANKYYAGGRPKLDGVNLITFNDEQTMVNAFSKNQISAMSGLENIPDQLVNDKNLQVYSTPLTTSVMTFFKTSEVPLNDANVRKALILAVDRTKIPTMFDEPVQLSDSPLLKGQLGYDKSLVEPAYDLDAANQLLDQAGWTRGADGIRSKAGQPLSFSLSAQETPNYSKMAQYLLQSWTKLGVKVQVSWYSRDELQRSIIANHDYDALLYGISIGVDPDVYAYWDSSQAAITSQGHLNLSEYKSSAADEAVEAGRTRSDLAIRQVKYKAFLTQWMKDLPALPLYQPNDIYISRGPVFNFDRSSANSPADMYYNANNWMIRQKRQTDK